MSSIAPHLGEDHVCELNHGMNLENETQERRRRVCTLICVYMCVVAQINAIVYMPIDGVYVYAGLTEGHIQRIIFD